MSSGQEIVLMLLVAKSLLTLSKVLILEVGSRETEKYLADICLTSLCHVIMSLMLDLRMLSDWDWLNREY